MIIVFFLIDHQILIYESNRMDNDIEECLNYPKTLLNCPITQSPERKIVNGLIHHYSNVYLLNSLFYKFINLVAILSENKLCIL